MWISDIDGWSKLINLLYSKGILYLKEDSTLGINNALLEYACVMNEMKFISLS